MPLPHVHPRPWGVALALATGLLAFACRSSEGERCVCADDCRDGLLCVAEGRVLQAGECSPIVGSGGNPGLCVDENDAGLGDEGVGPPDIFLDLGSKRDFDPGVPPDPEPATDSGESTDSGSTTSAESTGSSSGGSESGSSGAGSSGTTGSGSSSDSGGSSGSSGTTAGT